MSQRAMMHAVRLASCWTGITLALFGCATPEPSRPPAPVVLTQPCLRADQIPPQAQTVLEVMPPTAPMVEKIRALMIDRDSLLAEARASRAILAACAQ